MDAAQWREAMALTRRWLTASLGAGTA
jgi:hypothetical protein